MAAWYKASESRASYLKRLLRLALLTLSRWPSEAALITCIIQIGCATIGRITGLLLKGMPVTIGITSAIRAVFPCLQQLDIVLSFGEVGDVGISGNIFLPHQGLPITTVREHVLHAWYPVVTDRQPLACVRV